MTSYFPGLISRHLRHIQRRLNFQVPSFDFLSVLISSFLFFLAGGILVIVLAASSQLVGGAGVGYFAFDDTLLETFS